MKLARQKIVYYVRGLKPSLHVFCFRPPRFNFEAALQTKKTRQKQKLLRHQRILKAYIKSDTTIKHLAIEPESSETTTASKDIEEFQDVSNLPTHTDYEEDYDSSSGDMTDEDYL